MPEENQQAQVNAPESNPQTQVNTPESNPQAQATASGAKEPNKIMWILCYLWILFLIPMFVLKPEEKDSYIINHLRQWIGVFAIYIVWYIFYFIAWILGLIIFSYIGYLIYLIAFVFVLIGIYNAFKWESSKLPFVGEFFDKKITFVK